MLTLTNKLLPLRLAIMLIVTLSAAALTRAQTVVYDWSSNSKVPEAYPTINRKEVVTFNIKNVNDILFRYRLEVRQTPMGGDDFKLFSGLAFAPAPAPGVGLALTCFQKEQALISALNKAINDINADPNLPEGYARTSPHKSVPLQDSLKAWDNHAAALLLVQKAVQEFADNNCSWSNTQSHKDYQAFQKAIADIQKLMAQSHVFSATSTISPGNDVSATVFEIFNGETISSKTFTFSGTDVLTLSAGALFSTIPDRTYDPRKTPNSTLNVLTVEGNSRATPAVVALLNYSLGALKLDSENFGLALSAGPVLRLGMKSDASAFGFFTGISGNLYHRFYITPGIHFGQFSDFPVGFGNGSSVPANFGELTPVKRWTAKFGLAFTFKTKDFSGLNSSSTPSVTGDEANAGASPSPSPSPSPAPSGNGGSNAINLPDVPSPLARSFLRMTPVNVPTIPQSQDRAAFVETQNGNVERVEPVHDQEIDTGFNSTQPARPHMISVASPGSAAVLITALNRIADRSGAERIAIGASAPIDNYAMYFKNGRFYLVISQARIDFIQDGLIGRNFSDPLIEKRNGDLVLSFVLLPGTKARVLEKPDGLQLMLMPASSN